MLNVLFYHANQVDDKPVKKRFYLGTSSFFLKTYFEIHYPDLINEVNWLMPIQTYISDDELIALCQRERIDFLCTSHYIWNNECLLMPQLSRIKDKVSAKIVSGGPSISVHVDDSFFQKHPYIDYAIYGPGEKAFSDLLVNQLNNKKIIPFNTSNLSYFDYEKNKTVICKYEQVPLTSVSPYLHNKEQFSQSVKNLQEKGYDVAVPFDLTRGCPYSCTFCDWNSGLSNKVSRRKNSFKDDIDLFHALNIKTIYLADANIGQYQEDIDMISYMAKKNIEENAGFQVEGNLSKLRKDNNLKIMHLMAESRLTNRYGMVIAVQDINKSILDNINRPDVTWEVHKEMIKNMYDNYPEYIMKLQLILGLPGQTVLGWRETLKEIAKQRVYAYIFINELLPTSPAALDKEYQRKFQFIYSNSERFTTRKDGYNFYRGTFPASCISFTQRDFIKMTVLSHLYLCIMSLRTIFDNYQGFNTEEIIDMLIASENCKMLEENLYNNWVTLDKFYYTINFNGEPKMIPGDSMSEHLMDWLGTKEFQKVLIAGITDHSLRKELVQCIKNNQLLGKVGNLVEQYY
jgi:putative methyltransferase